MMSIDSRKLEKGSALILVLIAVLVLSIIGITGLSQTGTSMSTERNYSMDKTAFYTADSGVQHGLGLIKATIDPTSVNFIQVVSPYQTQYLFKSGKIEDASSMPVKSFLEYPAPPPKGISVEISGEMGANTRPWDLTVSANGPRNTKKEVQMVVVTMTGEY